MSEDSRVQKRRWLEGDQPRAQACQRIGREFPRRRCRSIAERKPGNEQHEADRHAREQNPGGNLVRVT